MQYSPSSVPPPFRDSPIGKANIRFSTKNSMLCTLLLSDPILLLAGYFIRLSADSCRKSTIDILHNFPCRGTNDGNLEQRRCILIIGKTCCPDTRDPCSPESACKVKYISLHENNRNSTAINERTKAIDVSNNA